MPLDVEVVREHVHWTAAAAAALRHGIQSLEDHLARCAADDADLFVEVTGERDGAADIQVRLTVGGRLIVRNVQDNDLAFGFTRVSRQLLEEVEHTLERATAPPSDEPWHQLAARVTALAHHEVHRAIDLGDAPAGALDPQDLAEEVLASRIHDRNRSAGSPASWESLRRALRAALEGRLSQLGERATDELSLEAPADRFAAEGTPIEEDPYSFSQPDETPLKNEDLIGGDEPPLSGVRRGP